MGGLRLREAAVGLLLGGVDHVRELDRVLDEEHRDVVADEVPVALLGVELHGEAADVAGEVGRALVAGDGGEADEGLGPLPGAGEQVGAGDVGERLVGLEVAVDAEAAGVDDALRDALVVEVEDLLAEVEVLEQGRAARAGLAASSGRRRPGRPAASSAPARRRLRPGASRRPGRGGPSARPTRRWPVRRPFSIPAETSPSIPSCAPRAAVRPPVRDKRQAPRLGSELAVEDRLVEGLGRGWPFSGRRPRSGRCRCRPPAAR